MMAEKKPALGSGKRFAAIEKKGKAEGYSKEGAAGLAAKIGREKYGSKKMAEMAKKGKERKK